MANSIPEEMNYQSAPGLLFNRNKPNEKAIIRAIEKEFDMPLHEIVKRNRLRERVEARMFLFYYLRCLTTLTLKEIGQKYGGFDHAAVLYLIRKLEDLLVYDRYTQEHGKTLQKTFRHLAKIGEGHKKTVYDFKFMNWHERVRYLRYLEEGI